MQSKRQVKPHGEAMRHLKKADPILYRAALPHYRLIDTDGSHRRGYRRNDLFAALAGSIVSQQLSTKAADTIWGRLTQACGGVVTASAVVSLRPSRMRQAGLSAAKVKSLKELARAIQTGKLDLLKLRHVPEEDAIERLIEIWGVGRWTAEMFLMFALRREDVFSVGDLGLVRAMEKLYGIPKGARREVYEGIAIRWAPHRTFACRVLWRTRDIKLPGTG